MALLLEGPPSQLSVSTETSAEGVMDVSSAGDSSTADLHVAGAPKALLVTVHSQRESDGAVIINLDTPGQTPPQAQFT